MRSRLYEIISPGMKHDSVSRAYDILIMLAATLSIVPLMFQNPTGMTKLVLERLETITVYLLFLDYILCWTVHDFKVKKHSPWAFLLYPLSPLVIFNLVSLLPSLGLLPAQFAMLRLFRLVKVLQYSKSCKHIVTVFKKEKRTLLSVLVIAIFYIFVSALVMYVAEPEETFDSFFHALYWATTALTTVGYGDVFPLTDIGRFISMISSLFGIAVIALPAGIVTAGFIDAISEDSGGPSKEKEQMQEAQLRPATAGAESSAQRELELLREELKQVKLLLLQSASSLQTAEQAPEKEVDSHESTL